MCTLYTPNYTSMCICVCVFALNVCVCVCACVCVCMCVYMHVQSTHSPHCSPTKPVVQSTDEDPSGADCEGRQNFKQNSLCVLLTGQSTLVSQTRPGLEPNLNWGIIGKLDISIQRCTYVRTYVCA